MLRHGAKRHLEATRPEEQEAEGEEGEETRSREQDPHAWEAEELGRRSHGASVRHGAEKLVRVGEPVGRILLETSHDQL